METLDSTSGAAPASPVPPGFSPLPGLWESTEGRPPDYPSEYSARWSLKQHRQALLDANALALHRGRLFVHRERFMAVVQQASFDACRRRYAG